ncbi:MAG TPA: hypothetical protein VN666_21915 [Nitrospira sp.]|nr:hypothetical protein [Nitrospira sp.]
MSSPLNPINVRLPAFDLESPEGRVAAHRYVASGVVDLNQAIAALKSQLEAKKTTVTSTSSSSSGGGGGSTPPIISSLGVVNDQLGVTAYTTQQADNGAKIIVGDASPVIVSLDNTVLIPWFTIIDNDSSSMVSLAPVGGSVFGENTIPPGGFGIVYFDGANFWCGATKLATNSSYGYVQPDNQTITVDSGSGLLRTAGATGTIHLGPFLDSSSTDLFVTDGIITNWVHTP